MIFSRSLKCALLLTASAVLGCDGQQYVSPDTVALVVRDESSGTKQLDECHYVPVLLGSRSVSRYSLEADLRVELDLTRDEVRVSFESGREQVASFVVPSSRFAQDASERAPAPPTGYRVDLVSPCSP